MHSPRLRWWRGKNVVGLSRMTASKFLGARATFRLVRIRVASQIEAGRIIQISPFSRVNLSPLSEFTVFFFLCSLWSVWISHFVVNRNKVTSVSGSYFWSFVLIILAATCRIDHDLNKFTSSRKYAIEVLLVQQPRDAIMPVDFQPISILPPSSSVHVFPSHSVLPDFHFSSPPDPWPI
jgi:hypothetical protein